MYYGDDAEASLLGRLFGFLALHVVFGEDFAVLHVGLLFLVTS